MKGSERTIIVTGASRGLGKAIAERFCAAGNNVVFVSRTLDDTYPPAAVSGAAGALAVRADVRNAADVRNLVETTVARWGRIDVLVNNAGITRDGLALRMTEQAWDEVLDTNLKGPFLCVREVSRVMMKQGSGHIVNIASITGIQGREGQVNYSAAKAGLIGLSRTAARELGRFGIQVNAVLPGYLGTSMGNTVSGDVHERILRENVLGRSTEPAEVAEFIYRLTLMQNVSGQTFNLDSRIV